MKTTLTHLLRGTILLPLALAAVAGGALTNELARLRTYDFNGPEEDLVAVADAIQAARADKTALATLEAQLLPLLADPQATFACKQFICRQLMPCASAQAVPTLAALLPDEKVGDMARYALGRCPAPAAGAALRAALAKLQGKPLIGVVNTLGERRDAEAVPALAAFLTHADEGVRAAAIVALGRIGTRTSLAALQKLPDLHPRPVTRALIECAAALVAAGETRAAADVYTRIQADTGYDRAARAAALAGLLTTAPDLATPLLLEQLASQDEALRRNAIQLVRQAPGADATRAFAKKLPTLPSDVQVQLLDALADRGDAEAVPALRKAAGGADVPARVAALRALGALKPDAETTALLLERAAGSDGNERSAARSSLRRVRGKDGVRLLLDRAANGPVAARVEAITALGDTVARDAAPLMVKLAQASEDEVRAAAWNALGKVAGAEDCGRLVALLLATTAERERGLAERAVVTAAREIADPERRATALLAALPGANADGQRTILRILPQLGGRDALAAILKASAADALREPVVRALADWPTSDAVAPMLDLLKRAGDARTRVLALRGLARLMELPNTRTPDETTAIFAGAFAVAADDGEKRELLPGVAKVGNPKTLALVLPLRQSEALREEAALAAAGMTLAMAASFPAEARATADELVQSGPSDAVRQKAKETIAFLERSEGFVAVWRLSEVFAPSGKGMNELFDNAFPPETNPEAGAWRVVGANKGGIEFDLNPIGGDNKVIYMRAELTVPADTAARLEIGSDDGVKAWMNGALVHQLNASRPVTAGQDKVAVNLKAGVNKLLLKVVNGGGNWGVICRVCNAEGGRLPGLTLSPTTDQIQGGLK